MTLDERAHRAGTAVRDRLAEVEVPAPRAIVQRVQHRRRATIGICVIAAAAVAIPVVAYRASPRTRLEITRPWAGATLPTGAITDGPWASVPKAAAGIDAGASLDALASTADAVVAAGANPNDGKWAAAIWRSDDGLSWTEAEHPSGATEVTAIAAHGEELLAIGGDTGGTNFVWRSLDDGRTWSVVGQGTDPFGPPAPAMGRPFVAELHSVGDVWLAAGGASDGYAGAWTSPDGVTWTSTFPTDNHAGSVAVVDDGDGSLLGYWGNLGWSSADASAWTPMSLSVPDAYYLESVAPGARIAFGASVAHYDSPTPLLRSSDHGRSWTIASAFLTEYPDARVFAVSVTDGLLVAAGYSGHPNHPDAWVSADGTHWDALPSSLYGGPGGTVMLAAAVNGHIVVMGTAPELDRFYVLDHSPG